MYSYNIGNDLKDNITYSFSLFEGGNFLEYYYEHRSRAIKNLNGIIDSSKEKKSIKDNSGVTGTILNQILEKIKDSGAADNLDFYVVKFEVNKILYDSYDEGRPQGAYNNIKNYILLSYCCLEKYKISGRLKYLNTSLKLNDIIISSLKNISDVEDLVMSLEIINLELSIIKEIVKRHD